MKQKLRAEMLKAERRGCGRIRRAWRVLWATPAQWLAVDAVLATGKAESRKLKAEIRSQEAGVGKVSEGGFDEIERVLSLALDALINAIDAYRDRKKGGSV